MEGRRLAVVAVAAVLAVALLWAIVPSGTDTTAVPARRAAPKPSPAPTRASTPAPTPDGPAAVAEEKEREAEPIEAVPVAQALDTVFPGKGRIRCPAGGLADGVLLRSQGVHSGNLRQPSVAGGWFTANLASRFQWMEKVAFNVVSAKFI